MKGFVRFKDEISVVGDVSSKLARFCLRLGGRIEEREFLSEFGCDVDPWRVITNFKEFKRLVKEAKNSDIERIYFGEHDAYFFAYPKEGEAGFVLSYDTEELPEEEGEKFQEDLESEFYDYMTNKGYPPEFKFIPKVEYGGDYIDVEARVPMEYEDEFSRLSGIAKAMLEFKSKLHELMRKYGIKAKIHSSFL